MVGAMIVVLCGTGCAAEGDRPVLQVWTVADTADLSIGELEGEREYLFQSIAGAVLLPDGGVAIADGGQAVVRSFDATGSFVAEMGGPGDGPGEFQALRDLWRLGDTLVVWDSRSRRLTYFALPATLTRVVSLEATPEASGVGSLDRAVGPLPGGAMAIASLGFGSPAEVSADRLSIERFDRDGEHLGRVLEGSGLIRFRVGERGSAPVPFSPLPLSTTRGPSIYFADGSSPSVVVWSEGDVRSLGLPVVEHDVDAAWAGLVEGIEEEGREFFRSVLPGAPRPDSLPQVAGLLVDDVGNVWTKPYEPLADALWLAGDGNAPRVWRVTDDAGATIATVTVPRGFSPLAVVDDNVLGIAVDGLGVERVQLRRLLR